MKTPDLSIPSKAAVTREAATKTREIKGSSRQAAELYLTNWCKN